MLYDLIIIGLGPAGLTAGIYAARRNLKTLIIGKEFGGNMAKAHLIENYPGFESISGIELSKKMSGQASKFGCEIIYDSAVDLIKEKDSFKVICETNSFESKAVILATGTAHRELGIKGEKEFLGKGVSYCPTCDGPFFRNRIVAVIGGSDSALTSAAYLSTIAKKVYLIHRGEEFRGETKNLEKILQTQNIERIMNSVVSEIKGGKIVESIFVKNVKTEEIKEIKVDGVFIQVGYVPLSNLLKNLNVKTDEKGYIEVNKKMETNVPGVFAAGDVTGGILQVAQAVGQGAIAAISAYYYIKNMKNPYY
ncbi:MAG: thioredoxin-disulfide reductase [archaeon]